MAIAMAAPASASGTRTAESACAASRHTRQSGARGSARRQPAAPLAGQTYHVEGSEEQASSYGSPSRTGPMLRTGH